MSSDNPNPAPSKMKTTATQFFLRGLAISLPPVLTLVILLWIGRGINDYIIQPISSVMEYSIAQLIDKSVPTHQLSTVDKGPALRFCGTNYRVTQDHLDELNALVVQRQNFGGSVELQVSDFDPTQVYVPVGTEVRSIPYNDFVVVAGSLPAHELPRTVTGYYMEVATIRHFQGWFGLSAFAVSITIVLLYFLGRIVTARLGSWAVTKVETVFLGKLPVISNVYSSVKQVTDFLFSERKVEYNRVVAIEYPRRGIWSLGFVTGDSMRQMTEAAGEPLISVLVPTSPMPVTGYTMNVPRNEVLDLDISIDQAFQYCISCGVLVPTQQKPVVGEIEQEVTRRLSDNGGDVPGVEHSTPVTHAPSPTEHGQVIDQETEESS